MADFGLSERSTARIKAILAKYPEVEQAIIYGSRAKGNYREGSDVDLTLKGSQLTHEIAARIWNDLDDSYLPYLFDLSIYHQLTHAPFIEHIDRVGQLFYQREQQ
ncbi:nucleotidyltransferase domain-containing protein [[Haemophilus] felis]|uniref:Polymerase beta nucleotidyltransferase domain-containing protein n=1 Tax=[Haemophilus] felis TaxID=123822 RepID=A0A1T0AVY2_9PAST|nr:nucleotidyltransferase domain-containing protein [[Haemophilus] felis]NBI41587.1 nucleotidyltransferase domain-containing protein [[Haemophilus] felis]NBI42715.1 nucleotidyltransferase domain-containing protein [[Haemophilus] felis]OOS01315.1 hypothetical protein B0188_09860 [[Haemophilus] felis]